MKKTEQKDYIELKIHYTKLNENDDSGVLEIVSTGFPSDFTFSSTGEMNFLVDTEVTDDIPNLMLLGSDLRAVILKHFSNIPIVKWE